MLVLKIIFVVATAFGVVSTVAGIITLALIIVGKSLGGPDFDGSDVE